MKARLFYGRAGRFGVQLEGEEALRHVQIKGKRLQGVDEYNPLAPGDWVELDKDLLIIRRIERTNALQRFNWKQNKPQTFCANIDLVFCVLASKSPEFHVRFLDRLLIAAEEGGVEPVIVINKIDEGIEHLSEYLALYQNLGYTLVLASALHGDGLEQLRALAKDKLVGLWGASGVGKSTLLNALEPNIQQETAAVNRKWNRGNHTTNFATFLPKSNGGYWVDTPGMRDFTPFVPSQEELVLAMPEIQELAHHCPFSNCQHLDEQECAVKDGVEQGTIALTRYQSYVKVLEESTSYRKKW
ncbi:ribosome small subunit-dependent GTPase A [Entomospira culicis]|uniref:Small ribosomal subunit biogenesis GTPase RsgA n=1 Tax=Entomospira culicis TaxID=2719989 RepID=A0A968KV87_9SPIO|nr:ribosome small subunit-dependent GTPase A [Entomospira culicis]NIZ19691.1 ribosome small subunit-dependent GTPase A [Entomospira culicis]NIZ69905.1 ribosome small subunit-dependent GTPase A [Entomospira culicis]WDI37010.1 ribosome small subunit-dependent GTPase A [Entomospira culicis]WDI38639.1 ribosome small subunit-dependent GTPase A [Entomospira culicis]